MGYTLDELPNDITRETPASFEPTIDYVVTKIPRWAFEKFPGSEDTLGTQMKSVGEAMSIGRTFKESLQKGLRSLETDRHGLGADGKDIDWLEAMKSRSQMDAQRREQLEERLRVPNPQRIFYMRQALRLGYTVDEIFELTKIDPWFLENLFDITEMERSLAEAGPAMRVHLDSLPQEELRI